MRKIASTPYSGKLTNFYGLAPVSSPSVSTPQTSAATLRDVRQRTSASAAVVGFALILMQLCQVCAS